jgi:hypothetical protein
LIHSFVIAGQTKMRERAMGARLLPPAVVILALLLMSGFDENSLSDADIDAVIAYLGRITGTPAH